MKSKLRMYAEDHASQILTIVGAGSMLGGTVLAVRATPSVLYSIEDKKDELEVEKLDVVDLVKVSWRAYLPAALVEAFGVSCLIGALGVNARKSTALAAACSLSENAYRTYAEKTLEVVGAEKEQEIRDVIGRHRIKEMQPQSPENHNLFVIGEGQVRCFDGLSGRDFCSDMNALKKAENMFNERLRNEMSMSLNDYYYELGLKTVSMGEIVGWNIDDGYVEFMYSSILNDDGLPCIYVEPKVMPERKFQESR